MSTKQHSKSKEWLVSNREVVGNALANVILLEGGREMVLGQAWLAAPGRMITCGHVVERFVSSPHGLFVKFPASGNRYPVSLVRLHPSFVRQPDQLVKFDVALLEVMFGLPESAAYPLPFSYEQPFTHNQTLWAIRYPAHLGQLSAATQPLSQEGKFLGLLRKHDSFHLLHDLPLAPGDSGAPICDGNTIVAIHCGDTATLPGLNLPTTSIRLALWVDALRELGLPETMPAQHERKRGWLVPGVLAMSVCALGSAAAAYQFITQEVSSNWAVNQPELLPVKISFNTPIHKYKLDEDVEIRLIPSSNCYLFLVEIDEEDNVLVLYPQFKQESFLDRGEVRIINTFGTTKLVASPSRDKLHLLVVDAVKGTKQIAEEALQTSDWPDSDREGRPLVIKGKALLERWSSLKRVNPSVVMHQVFDAPHSN